MKNNFKKIKKNGGAAMLISVIFFLFISLAIISGLVGPTLREFRNADINLKSKQSYFLAESGVEDAFYRIKNNMAIGSSESLTLSSNQVTTAITNVSGGGKNITSLGDVLNYERKISVSLIPGEGVSFNYGMQIGNGGLTMTNHARINGNVYVNDDVTGVNDARVTGTAIATGTISGMDIGEFGVGNAWAHTVNNSNIAGSLYCQTGSGNNKSCNTSQGDPAMIDFPISDEQIRSWKDEALTGGTQTGNVNLSGGDTMSIGPRKVVGNLNLSNNGTTLTVLGTLWVIGNISLSNESQIRLSSFYGGGSGVIIADGTISMSNDSSLAGSGTTGSYLMAVTTSTSASAINLSNNATTTILVAPYGKISFSNHASVKEVIARAVDISNDATLTYESGLINVNFTSGPSGGYNISSWKEAK
ncbi:hypothetical protein A2643_00570 [Candidatus Nomurabacteria bacterium RIFCSPHIGHO2_01_FULL_39_220]|uniref:Type 4 fimbrial biogenesis protein PilX N-terminal domain-containing protein n=1 Tax=Candidatus Nomurabacteria bacterium RIFCSPLOWO2_02_FULL_40_67 TaxID=1801787 RepID=A0A1F6Y472_9BACT|nr:MAG: hypothetical protein A2W12_01705 [Candidatus Nomurabacteria bacterium RBG_16_40_11]OGI70266.1 MAG: hypothetical protein A2643_00570 [Candidatus Nomurabacteria bacterium RIFCSPHIGHO2_01_FULL_39_220]OGI73469.1 MAG: hypothetical protein A2W56_02170 [Candidatus Nomurabacteria bacterium RIFCSPHIGHO2_02_41_18]OGI78738.1 MAG: hypothetical protein A3C65_02100 [Candidatus Nomurabacteria bacterium RIFCSPHIGHO2_02_FULL_41_150]OGI80815.1 MAG: hypothetical protein A3E03_03715 [Candidatus Nomurabacte